MRIILRNLFTTLRRFKFASCLNIIGLAVAFATFMVILMELHYDMTYNTCYKDYKRIYRLEVTDDSLSYNVLVGRNWEQMLREGFPQIEQITLRMDYSPLGKYVKTERNGNFTGFSDEGHLVLPNFPVIFGFEMCEGNADALNMPGGVMIPRSLAQKCWPGEDALGKKMLFADNDTTLIVNGVYKDFPERGMVRNVIYYPVHPQKMAPWDGWQFNYQMFITLHNGVDKTELEKMIYAYIQGMDVPAWIKEYKALRLVPMEDIYFENNVTFDTADKGNASSSALMFAIALLIIGIATVNYINFATSLTPVRIKSINTQKVLGNPVGLIRMTLIVEAVGISLIAYCVSLILLLQLQFSGLAGMFNADIRLDNNAGLLLLGAGLAVIVGVVAGIYPAFYSTGMPPALALKGSFGMSVSGRRLRTFLISFQFIISFILIIGALFLNLQNRLIHNADLGYDTEQIMMTDMGKMLTDNEKMEVFKNKLLENPGIKQVASSQFQFGTGDAQRTGFYQGDQRADFAYMPVSEDLLKVLGIRILEGRDFYKEDCLTPGTKLIINDAGAKKYGIKAGEHTPLGTVVGIMDNIYFQSLHHTNMNPLCFALYSQAATPYTYIKITGDPHGAAEYIKQCVKEIDPTYPLTLNFFDDVFQTVYQQDSKVVKLITVFSGIAVILSIMGVFGLVVFEAQYRRKEIAVRRIMGSTISELLFRFNKTYLRLTILCFVIALPVAYYGITRWLDGFEARTPLYPWVFLAALLSVTLITVCTVTSQLWKTVNANPADYLKRE